MPVPRQLHYCVCMKMVRTQISLEPELRNSARRKAASLGISLAEYIRRLLVIDLAPPERVPDPSIVFDLGDSGGADIAADKDPMLGEAAWGRGGGR